MLCNAHASESAHPQSYIIAHKLLICRFEVNCLHINPIIGEMLLIHINFQQNFPYFSSYDNFYCIEICLQTTYFTFSWCVLKYGFPKFGLFFSKPLAGFHCRKRPSPTFANIWSHCPWVLQSSAPVIYPRSTMMVNLNGQDQRRYFFFIQIPI